jgi:hypothetical protein
LQSGPKASLYLTLVGILAGFLSTFWSFGYQRMASKMQEYLDGANVAKVKKQQVCWGSNNLVVSALLLASDSNESSRQGRDITPRLCLGTTAYPRQTEGGAGSRH